MEKLKTHIVSVRVTADVYAQLAEIAKAEHRTVSQHVNMLIEEHVRLHSLKAKRR